MADLIDRLSGESEPARPKMPAHQFVSGLILYALGLVSRSELATNWDLQGDEATQASAVADAIDAEGGAVNKIVFVLRFDSIVLLVEDTEDLIYHTAGVVNKTKVIADSGI